MIVRGLTGITVSTSAHIGFATFPRTFHQTETIKTRKPAAESVAE